MTAGPAWILAVAGTAFMTGIALLAALSPPRAFHFYRRWVNPAGIAAAAAIRLAMGVSLFLAAPDTASGMVLKGFGALTFLAGLVVPFGGVARAGRVLDWAQRQRPAAVRAVGAAVAALGAWMIAVLVGALFARTVAGIAALIGTVFLYLIAG